MIFSNYEILILRFSNYEILILRFSRKSHAIFTIILYHLILYQWTFVLAQGLAVQSVAVQAVYWQRDKLIAIFTNLFPFFLFPVVNVSYETAALIKNLCSKFDWSAKKPNDRPLFRPLRLFWSPLLAILDFWGFHKRKSKNLLCES